MTSNIGSQVLLEQVSETGDISESTEKRSWIVCMLTSNLKF